MERREFLKGSCSLCFAVAAGMVSMESLFSCTSTSIFKTVVDENKIAVPASLFAQSNLQIIRAKTLEYDIALRKEPDGSYLALLLRCTHADNPLTSTGNGFTCNLHGSRFDEEGVVTKGPAEHPLKKFSSEIISENIIIHLS